ncbi:MAG: hypothetical protein JRI30_04860, partial [Deltaproteobacteria bacterium]|nr:hypothetical protein [Deltaproteobacteria bacterium]
MCWTPTGVSLALHPCPSNWALCKGQKMMIEDIFAISDNIRYVAIYRDGKLEIRSKGGTEGASSLETDRYEELLVNPTLIKLASQRGNIDCGGLEYLIVR